VVEQNHEDGHHRNGKSTIRDGLEPKGSGMNEPDSNLEARFKEWLDQFGGILVKVARAYTINPEDGEDLLQEILLQVWRSLPQFQGRAGASTWVYRVALNTALSWRRKEGRRHVLQESLLSPESVPGESVDDAGWRGRHELVERLYGAIHQLPKTDAALVLLYLDDLSYREMAEVLGISESNVGVKLNRAKKTLGELMKGAANES